MEPSSQRLTNSNTLGVDRAEICILKKRDEVCFNGLLQGSNRRGLEAEVGFEILGNFADQALERQLANQELSGLLVSTDLT